MQLDLTRELARRARLRAICLADSAAGLAVLGWFVAACVVSEPLQRIVYGVGAVAILIALALLALLGRVKLWKQLQSSLPVGSSFEVRYSESAVTTIIGERKVTLYYGYIRSVTRGRAFVRVESAGKLPSYIPNVLMPRERQAWLEEKIDQARELPRVAPDQLPNTGDGVCFSYRLTETSPHQWARSALKRAIFYRASNFIGLLANVLIAVWAIGGMAHPGRIPEIVWAIVAVFECVALITRLVTRYQRTVRIVRTLFEYGDRIESEITATDLWIRTPVTLMRVPRNRIRGIRVARDFVYVTVQGSTAALQLPRELFPPNWGI